MATLEELERALRNADKAGDAKAAQRFAAEIQTLRQQSAPAPSSFDQLPWYLKAAQATDDTVRNLANAITLGYADKAASALGGTPLEEERAKSAEARGRAGSAAVATDIIGLALPGTLASKGVAAAAPAIAGSGLPSTIAREGIAGGLVGLGMALGNDEDVSSGITSGAIGGAAGGAISKVAGDLLSRVGIGKDIRLPRKTLQEMEQYKNDMYEQLEKAGIRYSPQDIGNLSQTMRQRLAAEGIDAELHAPAVRRAKKFASRQPSSLKELDDQRQLIKRDVQGPHGVSHMGEVMDDVIREFIETAQPQHATTAQAKNTVKAAREANRKLRVRQDVEKAMQRNRNAKVEGEGPFRNLLNKGTRGMADEEVRLLENIVRGEGWEQGLANKFVDASAKIGSFGSGATAGGILAGPPGAVVGGFSALAVPPVAKALAKRYRDQSIEALLDELGGGKTIPGWLKKFLKNKGAVGGGLLANEVQGR